MRACFMSESIEPQMSRGIFVPGLYALATIKVLYLCFLDHRLSRRDPYFSIKTSEQPFTNPNAPPPMPNIVIKILHNSILVFRRHPNVHQTRVHFQIPRVPSSDTIASVGMLSSFENLAIHQLDIWNLFAVYHHLLLRVMYRSVAKPQDS